MEPPTLAQLLAMPEANLIRHVSTCPKSELRRIYGLGAVCRCEPFLYVFRGVSPARRRYLAVRLGISQGHAFGLPSVQCGDDGVPVRSFAVCQHTPETTLPGSAAGILLARLWPREYGGRRLDRRPSSAVGYEECLAARADRASRGVELWHPADARKADADGLADMFGLKMHTNRGGHIVDEGVVRLSELDGADYIDPNRFGVEREEPAVHQVRGVSRHPNDDEGGRH